MGKAANTPGIHRNLKDAGCGAVIATKYLQLEKEGKLHEQLQLLRIHRAALLKKVHDNQKRIDCLDYLIFSIKQQGD